jgi:hypothetical protein
MRTQTVVNRIGWLRIHLHRYIVVAYLREN